MYAAFVVAIFAWFGYLLDDLSLQYRELVTMYGSQNREQHVRLMSESIEEFYQETGVFPASLAELAAQPGFEHTRSLPLVWQGYALSPELDDGVWLYERMVFFSTEPREGLTQSNYLSAQHNACAAGSFETANAWCGKRTSWWFRRETREDFHTQITLQRLRLHQTLQKFAQYYSELGKFPDREGATPLAPGSIRSLRSLASYSGAGDECSGQFTYMDVPVDCADMFDLWGEPIGYQFESAKRIILTAETPIQNHLGKRLTVAAEYDFTLL